MFYISSLSQAAKTAVDISISQELLQILQSNLFFEIGDTDDFFSICPEEDGGESIEALKLNFQLRTELSRLVRESIVMQVGKTIGRDIMAPAPITRSDLFTIRTLLILLDAIESEATCYLHFSE
jgi:hypothetical protein